MKLTAPARLRERWRNAEARVDLTTRNLAVTMGWWRAKIAQHRVGVAVVAGGLGAIALTKLPLRALPRLFASIARESVYLAMLRLRARSDP